MSITRTENLSPEVSSGSGFSNNRIIYGVVALLSLVALGFLFEHGIVNLFEAWAREEYSHGPVIPIIAVFLIARQLSTTTPSEPKHAWVAVVVGLFAVLFGALGTLSNIADLTQYGLILGIVGLLVAVFGFSGTVALWAPILYLGFMIPLPEMVYLKLFAWTQLISSSFGTLVVRLVGIPVFLEGNIIDLGNYKLQVVEACSGLRYLFPLMSFGYLFAVLYQGAKWERVILFLSTIPIAIFMNSFRIGVVGVLVHNFGIEQAEGFLHLSEGWIIFVACIAILYGEATILSLIQDGKYGDSKWASLDLGFERVQNSLAAFEPLKNWRPLAALTGMFVAGIVGIGLLQNDTPATPERSPFAIFPANFAEWSGQQSSLPPNVEDVLAADDYILSNYVSNKTGESVNLFVAYYNVQNEGNAPHSPEVCIPGQGWEISSLVKVNRALGSSEASPEQKALLKETGMADSTITINRAVIQKGQHQQLVYYWFRERERVVASEYAAKWLIFWDSLTRNRTDGAMIRLITSIDKGKGIEDAERRLDRYLRDVVPRMDKYFPA